MKFSSRVLIGYSYENTGKTWNTDFIVVCQNLNLKPISYFLGVFNDWFLDLETIGVS
jgi:hypothetical protein